ncbi:hypothetical protein QE152_g36277 [Popillia japonica]|uniref:Uncharacterized protein n=1 Tax=Popillia japonica TaxID=7064 RepID=A0AAW1IDN8_POPJA
MTSRNLLYHLDGFESNNSDSGRERTRRERANKFFGSSNCISHGDSTGVASTIKPKTPQTFGFNPSEVGRVDERIPARRVIGPRKWVGTSPCSPGNTRNLSPSVISPETC